MKLPLLGNRFTDRRSIWELLRRHGLKPIGGAAAGHVQVAPDSSGKDVDADSLTSTESGTPTVYRQNVVLADPTTYAAKAAVANAAPAGTEYGGLIRNIPADITASSANLTTAVAGAAFAVTGYPGVSVNITGNAATFVFKAQLSTDGGTTWTDTFLQTPAGQVASIFAVNGQYGILLLAGTSHVRVVVNSIVSGTFTYQYRASMTFDHDPTFTSAPALAAPPTVATMGARDAGGLVRPVAAAASQPAGTEYGVLVRTLSGNPDAVSASVAMNGAGVVVSMPVAGYKGCGFYLASGTLTATLTPEVSFDGGVTYVGTQFYDPRPPATTSGALLVNNPNGSVFFGIVLAGGVSHVQVRVSSFTVGTANAQIRMTAVETVATAPTAPPAMYRGVKRAYAPTATTPSDIFTIACGTNKLTYVTRFHFDMVVTTQVMLDLAIIFRSTIDTAGTSTAATVTQLDLNNANAAATVLGYTANPTIGTQQGIVWAGKYNAQLATAVPQVIDLQFSPPVLLRVAAAHQLCLNLNAVTIAGPTANMWWEWYEV